MAARHDFTRAWRVVHVGDLIGRRVLLIWQTPPGGHRPGDGGAHGQGESLPLRRCQAACRGDGKSGHGKFELRRGFVSQSTFRTTELGGPCDAVVKLPTSRGYPMELRSSTSQWVVFARQPLEAGKAGTTRENYLCNTNPQARLFPFSMTIFCPRICTNSQKNQGHSPGRPRQVPKLAGDWTHKAPPPSPSSSAEQACLAEAHSMLVPMLRCFAAARVPAKSSIPQLRGSITFRFAPITPAAGGLGTARESKGKSKNEWAWLALGRNTER